MPQNDKPIVFRRNLDTAGLKIEKRADEARIIVGHAAVFDKLSEDMWGFREKIAPGAFTEAIKEDDIRGLWNHDPNYVLGRNKAGTLRLREDGIGLAVEIDPPDVQWARDLMVSIDRGDVTQMSFGFTLVKDEWDHSDRNQPVRTLKKVKLYDVSPVTYPAYPDTDVELNSLREKLAAWESQVGKMNAKALERVQRLRAALLSSPA